MALFTKTQFAEICGKSQAHVSMAIKRKQIELLGDFIDDQVFKNAVLKRKWQEAAGLSPEGTSINPGIVANIVTKKTKKQPKIKPEAKSITKPARGQASKDNDPAAEVDSEGNAFTLDGQKKLAEIEYKQAQIRKLKIQEDTLRGLNIPTALVVNIISQLGHSLMSNYKNSANQLFMELSHKAKLPIEIQSEFKGRLVETINKFHLSAIDEAKKNIKKIIEEVAIKIKDDQDGDV